MKLVSRRPYLSIDLGKGVRKLSREIGLGVTDALQSHSGVDEPGWRGERFTRGVLRGIDEIAQNEHVRTSLSDAIEGGVETAISAALTRSVEAREAWEGAAHALMRGALSELRVELGTRGEGPLTQAISASARRVARDAATAVAKPIALCAAAVAVALTGALLFRWARSR